jgi:hypothetical protein
MAGERRNRLLGTRPDAGLHARLGAQPAVPRAHRRQSVLPRPGARSSRPRAAASPSCSGSPRGATASWSAAALYNRVESDDPAAERDDSRSASATWWRATSDSSARRPRPRRRRESRQLRRRRRLLSPASGASRRRAGELPYDSRARGPATPGGSVMRSSRRLLVFVLGCRRLLVAAVAVPPAGEQIAAALQAAPRIGATGLACSATAADGTSSSCAPAATTSSASPTSRRRRVQRRLLPRLARALHAARPRARSGGRRRRGADEAALAGGRRRYPGDARRAGHPLRAARLGLRRCRRQGARSHLRWVVYTPWATTESTGLPLARRRRAHRG